MDNVDGVNGVDSVDKLGKLDNVFRRLQRARVLLQGKQLSKTGFNPFQKFKYFELQDFLPWVNEIFDELGLYGHFNLYDGVAKLVVSSVDCFDDSVEFSIPVQVLVNAKMQDIGSVITYSKRYLYMNALEIAECDVIDATDQCAGGGKVVRSKAVKSAASGSKGSVSKDELIVNINASVDKQLVSQWLQVNGYGSLDDVSEEVLAGLWRSYLEKSKQSKSS